MEDPISPLQTQLQRSGYFRKTSQYGRDLVYPITLCVAIPFQKNQLVWKGFLTVMTKKSFQFTQFQKNQLVWKTTSSSFSCGSEGSSFQKNQLVWKLSSPLICLVLTFRRISEKLVSMEDHVNSFITSLGFLKNFRKTSQYGSVCLSFRPIWFIALPFQKNQLVWKPHHQRTLPSSLQSC